jgi:hypothetical protein
MTSIVLGFTETAEESWLLPPELASETMSTTIAKLPMAMARNVPSAEAKTDLKKSFMGGGKGAGVVEMMLSCLLFANQKLIFDSLFPLDAVGFGG